MALRETDGDCEHDGLGLAVGGDRVAVRVQKGVALAVAVKEGDAVAEALQVRCSEPVKVRVDVRGLDGDAEAVLLFREGVSVERVPERRLNVSEMVADGVA